LQNLPIWWVFCLHCASYRGLWCATLVHPCYGCLGPFGSLSPLQALCIINKMVEINLLLYCRYRHGCLDDNKESRYSVERGQAYSMHCQTIQSTYSRYGHLVDNKEARDAVEGGQAYSMHCQKFQTMYSRGVKEVIYTQIINRWACLNTAWSGMTWHMSA